MNANESSVVEVSLPVSEFIDRYLISALKLEKFIQAGKSNLSGLKAWIDKHQGDFERIMSHSAKVRQATEALSQVHSKLWDLEDLVRSPDAEEPGYFAQTARQIFALNTDRHKLKHAIDIELPSLSFGPRLYDKGQQ